MMQWILTSCLLILAVLLLRKVGRNRLSARARYALWLLVLVRLLVPFSFGQSPLSVMNLVPDVSTANGTPDIYRLPDVSDTVGRYDPSQTIETTETITATEPTVQTHHEASVTTALDILWFAGCAMTGAILLSCNLRLDAALKRSRRQVQVEGCSLPVYETAVVETPCMFGLLRPSVYIIPELTEDEAALTHVLAHEQTHFRHLDHIWSLLRCVCLAVHWYNPLVWGAAYLSREDAELACDEGAMRHIGDEERTAYGETLISLTCTGHSGLMTTATTMTGSHRGLKERIKRIADRRKTSLGVLLVVVLLAVPVAVALLTGRSEARGVEGVWRAPVTVIGVGQENNDQTDNWLEYEFSDSAGRESHIVSGQVRSEALFTYTIEKDTLTMTFEDGSTQSFTWVRDGDLLTLSGEENNREILLTRYEGSPEEGQYQTTVQFESGELVSMLVLSDGQYVLSEPIYSSYLNAGTYTVSGDIITCVEYGEEHTYRFRRTDEGLVYLAEGSEKIFAHGTVGQTDTHLERREVPDGNVYAWVGAAPKPIIENPTSPGEALAGIQIDDPGLHMGLSQGTDPQLMVYKHTYGDVEQAPNGEHFLDYVLKLYAWELTERESVVYDEPRQAVMLTGENWSLTACENDNYVWFSAESGSGWYLADTETNFEVYSILRSWYDEVEYLDVHHQPLIPNSGQTPNEAAQSFVEQSDGAYLQVSHGSKYRYTYVRSTVVDGDFVERQTELMRQNGELGENEYCFYVETVFVPETEYALAHNIAGNAVEYSGTDPTVPAGAWQREACGIASLEVDGWHIRIVGTSW